MGDYCPEIFAQLREWFGIQEVAYMESVAGIKNLKEFSSNSIGADLFLYSQDKQYFIKNMNQSECLLLRKLLPEYHNYVSRQPHTLLSKFLGMHRVKLDGGDYVYFLIMKSIFDS